MKMTRIIADLWALATQLWLGAKTLISPHRTSTIREWDKTGNSFSNPSALTLDDDGSVSTQSQASYIPRKTTYNDEASDQHLANRQVTDDNQHTESKNASLHNRPDPIPLDPRSSISSSYDKGQPRMILEVVETEESEIPLPSPRSENYQYFPLKKNKHPERDQPNGKTNSTKSTSMLRATERKPHNILGRRGLQSQRQSSELRQSPIFRPELVCRKLHSTRMWEVVLSADDECNLTEVYLEGKKLDHANKECPIPSLIGNLFVSYQNELEHNITLFDGNPMIFKLKKNWAGEGHKTNRITIGHFIVIAPVAWERIGHVPVEPDRCTDTAFKCHYFYRDAPIMDEGTYCFKECDVFPITSTIEMNGKCVFDDSVDGILFVGSAPILKTSPDIVWARVGEEGKCGWKGENFKPDEKLLSEVLDGREGHFFLRVYDSEVKLLDSTVFRYLHNLRQISVNGMQYTQDTVLVPQPIGYPPTEVRFVGAEGSTIHPTIQSKATLVTVQPGILSIPPHPGVDCISCTLETDGSSVNIVLNLPRIWWGIGDDRIGTIEWKDSPLVMTRQEFQENARKNAMLWLLSKRINSIRAGFDDELDHVYHRTADEDRIAIPLNYYVDYEQIDRRLNDDVYLNIEWAGEILPLIMISADPIPEIVTISAEPSIIFAGQESTLKWATRNTEQAIIVIDPDIGIVDFDGTRSVRPADTTNYMFTLAVTGTNDVTKIVTVTVVSPPISDQRVTACVRSARRLWRNGKGFSNAELQEAGLTVAEAVGRSIPIDRRRRSYHLVNVDAIRRMLDA